jgi:hypothetical protein
VSFYLKKAKIEIPCHPVILLLGKYPKALKVAYNEDISTPMFIEALFIIAKLRNHPRCP